jgi:hypothetical protein
VSKFPLVLAGATAALLLGLAHDSHATGAGVGPRALRLAAPIDAQSPTEVLAQRVAKLEAAMAQQQADTQATIEKLQAEIDDRTTKEDSLIWAQSFKHRVDDLDAKFVCHQHALLPDGHMTGLGSPKNDCKYWDGAWHN